MRLTREEYLIAAEAADRFPVGHGYQFITPDGHCCPAVVVSKSRTSADTIPCDVFQEIVSDWYEQWGGDFPADLNEDPRAVAERFRQMAQEVKP